MAQKFLTLASSRPGTGGGHSCPPLPFDASGELESPPLPFDANGGLESPPLPFDANGGLESPPLPFDANGGLESPPLPFDANGGLENPPSVKNCPSRNFAFTGFSRMYSATLKKCRSFRMRRSQYDSCQSDPVVPTRLLISRAANPFHDFTIFASACSPSGRNNTCT